MTWSDPGSWELATAKIEACSCITTIAVHHVASPCCIRRLLIVSQLDKMKTNSYSRRLFFHQLQCINIKITTCSDHVCVLKSNYWTRIEASIIDLRSRAEQNYNDVVAIEDAQKKCVLTGWGMYARREGRSEVCETTHKREAGGPNATDAAELGQRRLVVSEANQRPALRMRSVHRGRRNRCSAVTSLQASGSRRTK